MTFTHAIELPLALMARAGRPLKRTLDLLTIRLLKAVAAKCRDKAGEDLLRARTA